MKPIVLGLDIGGANLKAATSVGQSRIRRFSLWKNPERLDLELRELTNGLSFDCLAVTMSGELCRCFETKRQGVRFILDAVDEVAGPRSVLAWSIDGRFHQLSELGDLLDCAATNWLALATFVGRFATKTAAVLVDVGGTTTDVVALRDGHPMPVGRSDTQRLESGELIYTGVRRTPLCAILGFEVMAEVFATSLDAYVTLGQIAENESDVDTADGRPATREFARGRLARMLGGDVETIPASVALRLAQQTQELQLQRIANSIGHLGQGIQIIASGSGEFLAMAAGQRNRSEVLSLSCILGPATSTTACAHAVAALAAEGRHFA